MDTRQERLSRLDSALLDKRQICSSEGVLCAFPSALKSPFMIDGVGLIICRQGNFTFILNQKTFSAKAGDTLFLPKDSLFQVLQASDNVEVYIFIYQTDPIRDFMGNSVVSMHLYSHLATEPCYVWNTGEEEEVLKYLSLLDSTLKIEENPFNRFRGSQVNFPQRLLDTKSVRQLIIRRYNGSNTKALAKEYGYSEKTIQRILRDYKKENKIKE